jgi:quercetin dioxygenase-like cupin family protein
VLTFEEWKPRTRNLDWASHPHDLCGYVLSGVLTLELDGRDAVKARKGDAFYVKAHQRHLPRNEGATPLKLVCIELKTAT